jgi:hypothetical protein
VPNVASDYRICVRSVSTGLEVEWAPGLAVERQLVTDLCDRVAAKGVGMGRTTVHVVADVRAALEELLHDLKAEVTPT